MSRPSKPRSSKFSAKAGAAVLLRPPLPPTRRYSRHVAIPVASSGAAPLPLSPPPPPPLRRPHPPEHSRRHPPPPPPAPDRPGRGGPQLKNRAGESALA